MIPWTVAADARIAHRAGLAGDLPGTYIRIISMANARSEISMQDIWNNTVREEV